MEPKEKTYKIVNIISSFVLIISYGLIMTQSIINIIYNQENKPNIIAERLVYEQFSHEVYSNIKSKIIKKIQEIDINDNCNDTLMTFPIKIESFYDCTGVKTETIDKKMCQNTITSDSLCCREGCCFKGITNKKENYYCLYKRDINESSYDVRDYNCIKYSKYNGRFYNVNNKKICVEKYNKNYEDLLKNYETDKDCNDDMIIFDSKSHFFCDNKNIYAIYNNDKTMVKNIFSVESPNYFEMETPIRLSKLLNKKKLDENKIKKEKEKIAKISAKSISEAFMEKESYINYNDPNYYEFKSSYLLNDIIKNSNENIFDNFKYYIYTNNPNISWYTRNYIGFNNYTELKKFKKYFDENDHKNNDLYKISNLLLPSYISFIIGAIIIIASIFFIIFSIKNYKSDEIDLLLKINKEENKTNLNLIKFILILCLFIAYLIIYLKKYYYKFEEINIDMEEFYSQVIKKYNCRRKQLYFLIGLILLGFNLFMELLILNLKCDILLNHHGANGISNKSIIAIIKLNDSNCNIVHKCKFYLNSKFSESIPKIKKILSRCNNCRENDITSFYLNNNEINIDNTVMQIGIIKDSLITID